MISSQTNLSARPAPPLRRVASLVYDSFVTFSFLIGLTAVALLCNQGRSLEPYQAIFLTYLLITTGCFLAWFWKKGQTLGMLAWKIRLQNLNQQPVTFKQAFLRYCLAILSFGCCGVGFLWCFIDKDKQTLHDKFAKTRVVY